MIRDNDTGELRPYDPLKDEEVPAMLFGPLPFDPNPMDVPPLKPERDLVRASAKTHGGE